MGVASRNRTNSLREMGEWSSGGCDFCPQPSAGEAPPTRRPWRTCSPTFIAASSCSASRSSPKKRASSRTPGGQAGHGAFTDPRRAKKRRSPTSQVHALVDDQLAVPQVAEDGLEVLRAAVDQVGSALVPLVPPHVWKDGSRSDPQTPPPKSPCHRTHPSPGTCWPACCRAPC